MTLKKQLGKLKFELNLNHFQVFAVLSWIFVLLVLPITVDQFVDYRQNMEISTESTNETSRSRVAGAVSEQNNFFTYTIDLKDKHELVSTLTFIFGSVSALIAVISLILFVKEKTKNDRGVFSS